MRRPSPFVRPARLAVSGIAAAGLVLAGCTEEEVGRDAPIGQNQPSTAPTTSSASAPPTAPPSSAPEGRTIEVMFADGEVSGETGRVPVPLDETVTIVVTSDVADEVHVHGYDVSAPVAPGEPAVLTFEATIPGVFEAELHEVGEELLSIQVS